MTLTTEHVTHIPPPNNGALPHPATIFRLTATTQLRKVTGLQKRWESAELSCSREIDVCRRRLKKRAWWPCGPAMHIFDSEIVGEIEELLKNVELGDADIYLRLYMIGKSPEKSRPVIMVCCSNLRVRTQAELAIRESRIPEQYPEFALGASALPLEQPRLVHPLAGMSGAVQAAGNQTRVYKSHKRARIHDDDEDEDDEPPPQKRRTFNWNGLDLAAVVITAYPVGRCIVVGRRSATGGVIIQVEGREYQLTVSHVMDDEPAFAPEVPDQQRLLEECHFDDMSEEDDELDSAVSNESDEGQTLPYQRAFDPRSTGFIQKHLAGSEYDSRNGPNPGLDYMLLPLDRISAPAWDQPYSPNEIVVGTGTQQTMLYIEEVASIPAEEQGVAIATASSGVIHGVLIPTAVYFRNKSLPHFQKLYPVHLERPVGSGDSGSAVVNETTGQLFGHIVRGAHQSTTAYMVAAVEVFKDIREKALSDVHLVEVFGGPPSILKDATEKISSAPYINHSHSRFPSPPLARVEPRDWGLDSSGFPITTSANWNLTDDDLETPGLTMTANTEATTSAATSAQSTEVPRETKKPGELLSNLDKELEYFLTLASGSPVWKAAQVEEPGEQSDFQPQMPTEDAG
nr:Dipeptidase [Chaetomium cochliodes]